MSSALMSHEAAVVAARVSLDQTQIFAAGEGDRWFQRNRAALAAFDPDRDPALRMLEHYRVRPRRAVDIGAGNGARLGALCQRCGATGVAVEISADAILDGQQRFPLVRFVQAAADAIPLQETFDLVIVNFVLHWVDRARLLRTAAEIDRLTQDGGLLLIGDFNPPLPTRTPYHHLPDQAVFTYKQDYAALFTGTGLYHRVAHQTGAHGAPGPAVDAPAADRTAIWLLRKSLDGGYTSGPCNPPAQSPA